MASIQAARSGPWSLATNASATAAWPAGAVFGTSIAAGRDMIAPIYNQIETTFDNIPQVGFSKLTFHLDGGPQGLLRSLSCQIQGEAMRSS